MPVVQFANPVRINVETGDVMLARQRHGKRQANISQADDGDGAQVGLTILLSDTRGAVSHAGGAPPTSYSPEISALSINVQARPSVGLDFAGQVC